MGIKQLVLAEWFLGSTLPAGISRIVKGGVYPKHETHSLGHRLAWEMKRHSDFVLEA